jgi:hypothetical protein
MPPANLGGIQLWDSLQRLIGPERSSVVEP